MNIFIRFYFTTEYSRDRVENMFVMDKIQYQSNSNSVAIVTPFSNIYTIMVINQKQNMIIKIQIRFQTKRNNSNDTSNHNSNKDSCFAMNVLWYLLIL